MLPSHLHHYLSKRMTKKIARSWSTSKNADLTTYRGVSTAAGGELLVSGLQLGNVFMGVQPLLGIEGDPMRLMFERDLTPHPQYAAFYKWLQRQPGSSSSGSKGEPDAAAAAAGGSGSSGFGAQAIVHFGMVSVQRPAPV